MHIYLAGKIDKNDWRHTIVAGLRAAFSDDFYHPSPDARAAIASPRYRWPILRHAIFDLHSYTGPYFISCDHGCAHGVSSHGVAAFDGITYERRHYLAPDEVSAWPAESINQDEYGVYLPLSLGGCIGDEGIPQERVVELCKEAIRASDLVFAWVDREDAYGTLVELGYASALNKEIWIAGPDYFPDLWFAYSLAKRVLFSQVEARAALQVMLDRTGEYVIPPGAQTTYCRMCGAPIVWTKTMNDIPIPLDLLTIEERSGERYAIIHFAQCMARRR